MKIGIIGAGRVGSTLGRRWAGCGHEIVYGVRNPEDSKHQRQHVRGEGALLQKAYQDHLHQVASCHADASRFASSV